VEAKKWGEKDRLISRGLRSFWRKCAKSRHITPENSRIGGMEAEERA
jgi:hypothetical protein